MSNFIKENNIFLQQIGKKKKEPLNKLLCFYISISISSISAAIKNDN